MTGPNNPKGPGGPPSHHEEFEAYLATLPPAYGRKLLFSEKCGLAYALRRGERHAVAAQAFGLSAATVSMLARCLQPASRHYRDVWNEFRALGEEAFRDRYYPPELHFRLKRIRLGLTHLPGGEADIAPARKGPDPRAAKYAGPFTLPDGTTGAVSLQPGGWAFKLDGEPGFRGAECLRGAVDFEPFASSSTAFDGAHEFWGYESPRAKPGRKPTK
jgi:hypothetical protein